MNEVTLHFFLCNCFFSKTTLLKRTKLNGKKGF